jgi:hypothetical protein
MKTKILLLFSKMRENYEKYKKALIFQNATESFEKFLEI